MTRPDPFIQFRRLLLGIVVEILQESTLDVDLAGLRLGFEPESGLRFLWVDNWMRFRGFVHVPLRQPADPAELPLVQGKILAVWPEIIGALGALPLVDRLDITRQVVDVSATPTALDIRFDLEAD